MHNVYFNELPLMTAGPYLNDDGSTFCKAAYEIANLENIPLSMVVQGMLGSSSLAHSKDVCIDYPLGGHEQINLFFVSIAGPGVGKGRAFKHTVQPIYDFQNDHLKSYKLKLNEYEAELMAWEDELKNIRKQSIPAEMKKVEIQIHFQSKPKKPVRWVLALQDTTPLGLIEQAQELPSIGIMTSEGRQFFNARNQQEMDKSAANWSGESITHTRKNYHIDIQDKPFTNLVFIQPGIFEKFMEKKGDTFRDSGYAARTNFNYIGDSYTLKYFNEEPNYELLHTPIFQDRIREGLETQKQKFEDGEDSKRVLKFSPMALNRWFAVHNEIEAGKDLNNPHARFHGALDHASRLMQNITRLAAHIHLINGHESDEISLNDLNQAILMGAFFSDTFRAMFVKPPQFVQDAILLDSWLNQHRGTGSTGFLRKNFLRRNGPNSLRKGERLDDALNVLQQNNAIRLFTEDDTTWINLFPLMTQDQLPEHLKKKPRNSLPTPDNK